MGNDGLAISFIHGFPIIGDLSQDSTYPTNEKAPPPSTGADGLFNSISQRFCERASGRDPPLLGELWEEALQQQREGWLREPILVSENGRALNAQGEVLNLASVSPPRKGAEIALATIYAARSRIELRPCSPLFD